MWRGPRREQGGHLQYEVSRVALDCVHEADVAYVLGRFFVIFARSPLTKPRPGNQTFVKTGRGEREVEVVFVMSDRSVCYM